MFRRRLLVAGLSLPVLPVMPTLTWAQAGGRVALVIGNGAYRNGIPALQNPPRDAQAIARVLERLGFQVSLLIDATAPEMRAAVRDLGNVAQGKDAALLFYAGHAAEVGGRNILFPVSVSIDAGAMLEREGVAYDDISTALTRKARATLIFFDACRDNPFTDTKVQAPSSSGRRANSPRGLTRSVGHGLAGVFSPDSTLIAYSTAPGQVALDGNGENSPFTTALLQHIETSDIEVRDMLTRVRRSVRQATQDAQVPWDNSSLNEPFFMRVGRIGSLSPGPSGRIVDEAAVQGIPLPARLTEERFRRPSADVGPAAQFIGSWSTGSERWGSQSGRRCILIVLSVDPAQGLADTIVAYSAFTADNQHSAALDQDAGNEALYRRRTMRLLPAGTTLEWSFANGRMFRFNLSSATSVRMVMTRNSEISRAAMHRID